VQNEILFFRSLLYCDAHRILQRSYYFLWIGATYNKYKLHVYKINNLHLPTPLYFLLSSEITILLQHISQSSPDFRRQSPIFLRQIIYHNLQFSSKLFLEKTPVLTCRVHISVGSVDISKNKCNFSFRNVLWHICSRQGL
jgi:hypothetical protein